MIVVSVFVRMGENQVGTGFVDNVFNVINQVIIYRELGILKIIDPKIVRANELSQIPVILLSSAPDHLKLHRGSQST